MLVAPIVNEASWDGALMDRALGSGHVDQHGVASEAAAQSDYVYTDTWVDMEHFHTRTIKAIKDFRMRTMLPYQLTERAERHTPYIMHDMPIIPASKSRKS